MSKFAAALKEKAGATINAASKPAPKTAEAVRSGAREGTKHIGGYFTPQVSKQLRSLAVAEDSTVQDLLAEALNMLFQSRGMPMIAAISREQATALTSGKLAESAPSDNK
jgi:Antitoxin-like ribbon-helix-helix